MNLPSYLSRKLNITIKEAHLLTKTIKNYIQLKENSFVDNEYLPKDIVKKLNDYADTNGDLVLSDMFDIISSNMYYFMGDPIGKKFFSTYSHGMNLSNLEEFNPDDINEVSSEEIQEILKNYQNELDIPNISFNNPINDKMYRELYVYKYSEIKDNNENYNNIIFNIKDIKKYISENPEFKRIFDQKKEGKELVNNIANKKIKTFQDAIDYLKNLDSEENLSHGEFLTLSNIETDIKKWRTERDVFFKGHPHYVFVVSLTSDAYNKLKVETNKHRNFQVPQLGNLGAFFDYYKSGTHSHNIVTIPNKFCIGWVRFTVYSDDYDRKSIIVDELQSDLNVTEKFDKYKTGMPEELFSKLFINQENLYNFIFKNFIKIVREDYGYQKIYAVEYDTKVRTASSVRDYSKYKNIARDDLSYLQQMVPPRFPYENIIRKNFAFSKVKSDLPGFLLLEKINRK